MDFDSPEKFVRVLNASPDVALILNLAQDLFVVRLLLSAYTDTFFGRFCS